MKVLILYGEPVNKSHWLYKEIKDILNEKKIVVEAYGSKKKNSALRKYKRLGWLLIQLFQFITAVEGIIYTKNGDIIISDDFGTGRICSALAVMLHRKRKVLALNCLQRGNSGLKQHIENILNYFAWKNNDFTTTINTEEERKKIIIPSDKISRVYILEDTFIKETVFNNVEKKYDCMTGGYANRDFNIFFEIARREPLLKFCCVVGSNFVADTYDIPDNCTIFKNVTESEFFDLMKSSKIISVPLLKDEVSGLVVFKNAIRFGILPIASRTSGICNYIPDDMVDDFTFEIGDADGFQDKLANVLKLTNEEYIQHIDNFQKYNERFSPRNQCERIIKIIENEKWI